MLEFLRYAGMSLAALVAVAVLLVIYFLPTIIASKRRLTQKKKIGWLNLLLGWTTAGWIVLLIFALLTAGPPSYRDEYSAGFFPVSAPRKV
ncbi:MAG TPA: superinfection immunity protein [Candidatus Acidoferrales bacterium]|nr:superinfection immunity protein [Candidatus Acidoferrales bacterium]